MWEKPVNVQEYNQVESIMIQRGRNKHGEEEKEDIYLKPGDIVSVVGPTGSGKSRLLADIEWLARGDTPTGRTIYINGSIPDDNMRYQMESKLVAQLSQNMNFVMDASVEDFIGMHGKSRAIPNVSDIIEMVIQSANALAGESFTGETLLTALSGGQSRALMIADVAFLSQSPIVLIDEIENAGIDRRCAINLLVKKEKIVLIATHDPVLALMADQRLVIKQGGIVKIIKTNAIEKNNLVLLEKRDQQMLSIRNLIREGNTIYDLQKEVI